LSGRERYANVKSVQEQLGRDIRMAMVNRDVALLAKVVGDLDIEQHLQAAGAALLTVRDHLSTDDDLCRRIAADLAALLEKRDWSGDSELAALLLEPQPTQPTRPRIRADLDQVADLLEGSLDMGYGGVLDMQTGDAWPEAALDDWPHDDPCPNPDNDPERYLFVPNEGSRDAWQDMHDFATGVSEAHLREQLLDAIDGRGAFGRFKRVLDRHEGLWPAWNTYSTEARCGRARAWLYDAGYDALPDSR
jgi:hypothetical protein